MAARSAASGGIIPDRGEAERAGQCARLFPRPPRTGRCQRMWPMSKELPGWACRRCRRTRDQRLRLAPDGPAPGGLKWRAPWTWWVKSCRPGLQEGPGPGDRHLGAVHREDRGQQVGGAQFGQVPQLVLHRRFAAHDGDITGAFNPLPFQYGAVAGKGGVVLEERLARARVRSGRSVTATGIPTQTRGGGLPAAAAASCMRGITWYRRVLGPVIQVTVPSVRRPAISSIRGPSAAITTGQLTMSASGICSSAVTRNSRPWKSTPLSRSRGRRTERYSSMCRAGWA